MTDTIDGWVVPAGARPPRGDSLPWAVMRGLHVGAGPRRGLIDVGANVGRTVIPPLLAGDVDFAYAIEPDPATFACLQQNVERSNTAGRIITACCAASDTDGEAVLYRATAPTTRRLVGPGRKAPAHKSATVPTRRLDTLAAEWRLDPASIGWIKLDVQGWESRVLDGADTLVREHGIVWVIEISPKHLTAAGTPLADVLRQLERLFSHGLDLRRGREPLPTRELAGRLAYLEEGANHTDLLLYHA